MLHVLLEYQNITEWLGLKGISEPLWCAGSHAGLDGNVPQASSFLTFTKLLLLIQEVLQPTFPKCRLSFPHTHADSLLWLSHLALGFLCLSLTVHPQKSGSRS